MDELIKQVSEKTGMSQDQARTAVNIVIGFLKNKLPAPIAGQIDNALGGESGSTDLGGLASKVGGFFNQ